VVHVPSDIIEDRLPTLNEEIILLLSTLEIFLVTGTEITPL
jgi:hypothetical protein